MKRTRLLPPDDAPLSTPARHAPRSDGMRGGLLLAGVALLLGLLPWFSSVGLWWTLLMGALLATLWYEEIATPQAAPPLAAWLAPFFALLTAAQAYRMLSIGAVGLLWLAAAYLLAGAQWKRLASTREYSLDWRRVKSGYRLYVALGSALCWIGIAQPWGRTPNSYTTIWMGDYDGSMVMQPIMLSSMGYEYSGRGLSFAAVAIAAALLPALWAMASPASRAFVRGTGLVRLAVAVCAVWWLMHQEQTMGSSWFLVGLALCGFGVWRLGRGEESGAYDAAGLWRRLTEKSATKT